MTEEKQEHKQKPKMIEVRTVRTIGGKKSIVVEYVEKGELKRTTLPIESVNGGKVDAETLGMGVPYGIDWSGLKFEPITGDQLAEELHKNGIWTREDVQRNPGAVQGAFQKIVGLSMSKIYQVANGHNKE